MKTLMTIATVLLISSVQAADAPKFGDINYFFHQGEFNVLADANVSAERFNNGIKYEERGYIFETQFTYGISDRLNAFIGLDYAWNLEVEDMTQDSPNAIYNQDGLANPELGVIYRFIDQKNSRYNVDFGAVARVNIEDAERGSSVGQDSADGTFASGRSGLEVFSRIGRKWNEANEWQLGVGGIFHLEGESTNLGTGTDSNVNVDEGSSLDLYLRGSYQYRPVNEFMVLVFAQVNHIGEKDIESGSSESTLDAHIDLNFGFTAKYLITDNVIGRINYGISNYADFDVDTAGVTSEVKGRAANFYGLGVDILF